ncbi:NAC domain containing protein 47, partial [Prunus dulcis]
WDFTTKKLKRVTKAKLPILSPTYISLSYHLAAWWIYEDLLYFGCLAPRVLYRFHPTDEELVDYYLRKKIASKRIDLDVIKDVIFIRLSRGIFKLNRENLLNNLLILFTIIVVELDRIVQNRN